MKTANAKPVADPRFAKEALKKAIHDCPLDGITKKLADQGGLFKDEELFRKELNTVVETSLSPALELAQAAGVPRDEVHKLMAEFGSRISKLHQVKPPASPRSEPPVNLQPVPEPVGHRGVARRSGWSPRGTKTRRPCLCGPAKWLIPLSLAAVCLVASMGLLQVATHSYAQQISFLNRTVTVQRRHGRAGSPFALGGPFGGLDDPARDRAVTTVDEPTRHVLRYLNWSSAMLAAAFVLLALRWQELLVWGKVMLSTALLALGQGALALATVAPSPAGWATCRDILGHEGVSWLGHHRSLRELFFWIWQNDLGQGVAECSQVLWAGRSYLLALYALGLYELVAVRTSLWPRKDGGRNKRRVLLFVLGSVLVAQQAVAVYYALTRRLGYSADIVMTLLATALLYTGGPVAKASKRWLRLCSAPAVAGRPRVEMHDQDGETIYPHHMACRVEQLRQEGDLFVPPCCFPFCCLAGRYTMFSDDDFQRALIPSGTKAADVIESLRMENTGMPPELSEWDQDP